MTKQLPFWLIAIAVLIGITVPVLIKDGMFMDGMLYTSVSHNLSEGIGTFWFPQFSLNNMSGLSSFHEQPPLAFGIQAVFYKIFGNSLYTERIYVFTTLCVTAWLINLLWKEATSNSELKKLGWIPIILWITTPDCFGSYSGNMMENTLSVFTLASGLFAFKALKAGDFKIALFILSGAFVFLATLTKGVPGFFTIAFPFTYWIALRKISFKRMVAASMVIAAIPVLLYGILLLFPQSKESLSIYFFKRLLGRINNEPSVSSRLNIVWHLLSELIPQFCLIAIVVFFAGIKRIKSILTPSNNKLMLFFALAGLAGSLPIMITKVQSGWYIVPSYPLFAISIGLFVATLSEYPLQSINTESRKYKIFTLLSAIALLIVLSGSFLQIGKTSRDAAKLHDVYAIGKIMPSFSVVSVPPDLWNDWGLQGYLMRYFNISIDKARTFQYFLVEKIQKDIPPAGYTKLNIGLLQYDLYIKQNN